MGWRPDDLVIDRFGLTRAFINRHRLPWIDGLETGSGMDLGDPDHRHHDFAYVPEYLREHGRRKVEANALVVRADAARDLLRSTIAKYLPRDAPADYERSVARARQQLQRAIVRTFGLNKK